MREERTAPCTGCGRALRASDAWCPLCHERAPDLRFRAVGASVLRADDLAPPPPPPLRSWRHSRTAATEVTFGFTGRVVCTVLLLLLCVGSFRFSPLSGLVLTAVGLPWALRDVWRRVRVHR